ncbi:flagellar motor protein MotB [Desulfovibrio sp. OttesenSCG-928-C14]|nr:flagellar motor protein MotB [Desulfovibrio sp. OttesenSCG-928-C14]
MSGSWKVAYADFVTAMMAFFLLMWILAKVPEDKQAALAGYFASGGAAGSTGNLIVPEQSMTPPTEAMQQISPAAQTSVEISRYLGSLLRREKMDEEVRITPSEAGVLLRAQSGVMFGENETKLNEKGQVLLQMVAETMRQFKVNLVVRGHADSMEGTGTAFSKWDLSALRASSAMQYLVEQSGINPSLVMSAFYGDSRPVVPDSGGKPSPENRRLEFFFHRPEVAVGVMGY